MRELNVDVVVACILSMFHFLFAAMRYLCAFACVYVSLCFFFRFFHRLVLCWCNISSNSIIKQRSVCLYIYIYMYAFETCLFFWFAFIPIGFSCSWLLHFISSLFFLFFFCVFFLSVPCSQALFVGFYVLQ